MTPLQILVLAAVLAALAVVVVILVRDVRASRRGVPGPLDDRPAEREVDLDRLADLMERRWGR